MGTVDPENPPKKKKEKATKKKRGEGGVMGDHERGILDGDPMC
jgi:hypothetical protein